MGKNVILENASFQGYITEVSFDISEGNSCHIFKMTIFSIFYDFMRQISHVIIVQHFLLLVCLGNILAIPKPLIKQIDGRKFAANPKML